MAHQHMENCLIVLPKSILGLERITISFFLLKLPSGIPEQETNKEIKIN